MEARNPKSVEKETKPDQPTVDNRGRLFDNPFKYRSASKQRFARRFSKLPSSLAPTLLPFSPPRLVIYARASFIFTALHFHFKSKPALQISRDQPRFPWKFSTTRMKMDPGMHPRDPWNRNLLLFLPLPLLPSRDLREIFERPWF